MQSQMIKDDFLSEQDAIKLREQFAHSYCKSKGWDVAELNFEQSMEIRSHVQWKSPGMIKG